MATWKEYIGTKIMMEKYAIEFHKKNLSYWKQQLVNAPDEEF